MKTSYQTPLFFLTVVIAQIWGLVTTDFLLVADYGNSTIYKGSLLDFDLRPLPLDNVKCPAAVEYDPIEQMVYWTESNQPRIARARLDGSLQETLVSGNLSGPEGLALDPEEKLMFWTDISPNNRIERALTDGSDRRVIVWRNVMRPRDIVADNRGRHIYWTCWGDNAKIERANYNGRHRVTLVEKSLFKPNGIALDVREGCLYWCDAGTRTLEVVNLQGNGRAVIKNMSEWPAVPYDLSLYGSALLWTDLNAATIMRMQLTQKLVTNEGPFILQKAAGMHVYAVPDSEAPFVYCPADVTLIYVDPGMANASVTWIPILTANDSVDGPIDAATIVCSDDLGNVVRSADRYLVRVTTVTCRVKDSASLEGMCQFSITVKDNQPPTVICPSDSTTNVDLGFAGAIVVWSVSPDATDVVDAAVNASSVVCEDHLGKVVRSGEFFHDGVTTVTCRANDTALNEGFCMFSINIAGDGTYNIEEYFEDTHSNTTWHFEQRPWSWNVAVSLCLAVVGIAANVALLLVILLTPHLRTTSNILVVNLAIADIMMFVFSVPMSTMNWLTVSFPEGPSGTILCKLMGGAWGLSQVLCSTSLTAVSIERFCTLRWRIQMKRTVVILVTVWTIGLCFALPLWVFGKTVDYPTSNGRSEYFCRLLPASQLAITAFFTSYAVLTYFLPVLIIIICYVGMAQILVCRKPSGESVEVTRARRRLAVVVLVLAVAFVVFWFPYHFINMFFIYASIDTLLSLPFKFYLRLMEIAHVLIYVNSCLNPFVVFLISGVHRKPLLDFLCCRKHCGKQKAVRKVDGRYAPLPDGVYTETVFSTSTVVDRE